MPQTSELGCNVMVHTSSIQNSQAVKKCAALKSQRCEIKGGSQEMAVIMVD